MRLLRDPVRRGSLWVVIRHYPAYAVALALGTAALAVSVLSGRTFLDAADIALAHDQLDAVPATAPADEQGRVRASVADGSPPRVEDAVARAMDGLAGGGPVQEVRQPVAYLDPRTKPAPYVVNPATGERTPGVVFDATGALGSLVPATGSPEPGASGLWLPDTVATPLHLAAGDQVGLQLAGPGANPAPATATVAGVYLTDADGVPRDRTGLWHLLVDELPVWPGHLVPTTPQLPLVVADTGTYRTIVAGIRELSLVTWDVAPDADPARIQDLNRLYESGAALRDELKDHSSELNRKVRHRGSNPVTVSTGLSSMVVQARGGLRATDQGVSAVRVLAVGLSWLVVALAAVALLIRRGGERQVLVEQGRSSLELTTLSVAGAVVPVVAGLLAGWWASPLFVAAIVGPDGVAPQTGDAVLIGAVVLATVAVASATDAFARHRRASGRAVLAARRIPWRSAVLALAAVGAVSAYRGGREFDAVTAAFPLAAVGAVAIVVSAAATVLLARLARRWLPHRLGPRMVVARLARDPASATAFLAATVAFGAAGYGLLFHASADDATTDKVATQVGANSVFAVDDPTAAKTVAAGLGDSTVVLHTVPRIGTFTGDRLSVVDASTFASAALWSPRFAGRDLSDLTRELHAAPGAEAVPVVLAGSDAHVPPSGTLSRGTDWSVPYRVVDRISGFAGSGRWQTVLVVDQQALLALAPPGAVDSLEAELWSARDADTVTRAAKDAGLTVKLESTADGMRASHATLVARSWVTGYLQAFTALALLLGLLVLAGLQRRDREQRRLQDRTLADLGHPRRLVSRAAAAALSVVALLGAVAGGVAAYAVTASLATRLDPEPSLQPALVVTGTGQLVVAGVCFAAVALVLTLVGGAAERWLGRTRSVNELLHDE
ncbi:MAG TPA: hypothetical protein VFV89_09785 [Nocardioides sp.]|uniref:hypothetical protein n=1 Tax=Nocardioides sp. TaxID=35761 RepID=UPI002E303323|nr:hypothetical protein [Nocardioides sp.]HEX5088089.1 hypothetical protein [Nocardioides sp.]